MTTKNLGPLVSGYLVPDGRNWESSVFQAGKPVLDKELNLAGDIALSVGQFMPKLAMPSGWISKWFLAQSDPSTELYTYDGTYNELTIPYPLVAHVNGWLISVANTNSAVSTNVLDIGAPPSGIGVRRVDLVILEVWRRLIAASPSTDGKSALGRIWRDGNVKIPAASDGALNYADDLFDSNVGSETTKRVQIQYRLRVIQGVDLLSYPFGIDDPSVVARSVPVGALLPDGNVTVFTYGNQSSVTGDSGLWVAGNGDPTNTLGTVDGYMYALPLLAVVRRNDSAFDKNTNHNGAGTAPAASGRPDNLYANVIEAGDIIDLRAAVTPNAWNFSEVLEKHVNRIFDNVLKVEPGTTAPQGAGCDGTTYLWADEIGISNAHGGDGIDTGDTPGAELIGEFDASRRCFSDRSIYEVVTIKLDPPGGGWVDGCTVTVSPTALPIYPYAAFNWAAYNSAHVMFMDILSARWVGPAGLVPLRLNYEAVTRIQTVTGLGVQPVNDLTITFGNAVTALGLTDEPLYVELLIAYPPGLGLTKTPTTYHGFAINNPAQMPAIAPVSYQSVSASNKVDIPHRELQIQYDTSIVTITMMADFELAPGDHFRLPERAGFITNVLRNGAPLTGSVTLSSDGRTASFTNPADYTVAYDDLTVSYSAIRPFPQNDEQVTVYYTAAAPQTVREGFLPDTLTLIPRHISPSLYVVTTGSGSQDEGYPFPVAYNQTGGVFPALFTGEHELAARADIAIADFNATTGFVKIPAFIGYTPSPNEVTYLRSAGDADVEGRTYYKAVPAPGYVPNAYGQDLSDPKRHKVILPLLAELATDSVLGFRGQLVTVLLMRWAQFDETNGVWFDSNLIQNATSACVFRTNLLNGKM